MKPSKVRSVLLNPEEPGVMLWFRLQTENWTEQEFVYLSHDEMRKWRAVFAGEVEETTTCLGTVTVRKSGTVTFVRPGMPHATKNFQLGRETPANLHRRIEELFEVQNVGSDATNSTALGAVSMHENE